MSGGKFTWGQVSSEQHGAHKTVHDTTSVARHPPTRGERIAYGAISEVDFNNYQVKVRLFAGEVQEVLNGAFIPLINPIDDIFMRYGQLREGLFVRVFWRGQARPKNALAEIIGGEDIALLRKQDRPNEVDINPFKFLGGGMETGG